MSDYQLPPETPNPSGPFNQPPPGYYSHPQAPETKKNDKSFFVFATVLTLLVLFIIFQQFQIAQIQNDLRAFTQDWKKENEYKNTTMAGRLDAVEAKMEMLDSKLGYVQTAVSAAAQKADAANAQAEARQQQEEQQREQAQREQPPNQGSCFGPFCIR